MTQGVGIISLIAQYISCAGKPAQQLWCGGDVGDVAGRELQDERAAKKVGERMNFARLAAAGEADGLFFDPPFPPKAER